MMQAAARAVLTPTASSRSPARTADIGTGTYTIMTQIAAETLGLPLDRRDGPGSAIRRCPKSPVEGGSWAAASAGCGRPGCLPGRASASCWSMRAGIDDSPLANAALEDVDLRRRQHCAEQRAGPGGRVRAMRCGPAGVERIEAEETASPEPKRS